MTYYSSDLYNSTTLGVVSSFSDGGDVSSIGYVWLRDGDIFNFGGEEFIGIIRNVDISNLSKIGNRIRALVEHTHVHTTEVVHNVTISIGATIATTTDSIQSLLKRVDDLMYKSKTKGRNCLTTDH